MQKKYAEPALLVQPKASKAGAHLGFAKKALPRRTACRYRASVWHGFELELGNAMLLHELGGANKGWASQGPGK